MRAPWELKKLYDSEINESVRVKLQLDINSTVFHCAEALRLAGILLQPYIPGKAAELLNMLGVDESRRTFAYAKLGEDRSYGVAKVPLGKCAWDALFPPLAVET